MPSQAGINTGMEVSIHIFSWGRPFICFCLEEKKAGYLLGYLGIALLSVFLPADFRSDPEMYRQYGLLEGYLASSGSSGHGMCFYRAGRKASEMQDFRSFR